MHPRKELVAVEEPKPVSHSKQWNTWYSTLKEHNEAIKELGGKPVKFSVTDSEAELKAKLGHANETLAKLRHG